MNDKPAKLEPWRALTQWTSARIAMGRAGASMRTFEVLEFNRDHALARDAIYMPLDAGALRERFVQEGFPCAMVGSRASNRSEYLRRPDLGRTLQTDCAATLQENGAAENDRLTVVVADGLSALAPKLHALPLLKRLRDGLVSWQLDTVIIATQARVALGDEIGQLRKAKAVLMLIGERPGLKAADSLGAYLTYQPKIGRLDAERNCISNIRLAGLSYEQAAFRLLHLLSQARLIGATGIALKDDSASTSALEQEH
ncbi:ethanolamine ammonia-lyase subunit EutC [Edaphobacter flagellatus]|uniref:ethanolamine ammonia-lyase subunit EutC n=1 Tax=Edaphobacter flagellatus TaxID=1933044 RepID=UPI0021B4C29B|nr:ethanolamine ammonia-lyase subunit EutC [Edaphobacter flagellatus]